MILLHSSTSVKFSCRHRRWQRKRVFFWMSSVILCHPCMLYLTFCMILKSHLSRMSSFKKWENSAARTESPAFGSSSFLRESFLPLLKKPSLGITFTPSMKSMAKVYSLLECSLYRRRVLHTTTFSLQASLHSIQTLVKRSSSSTTTSGFSFFRTKSQIVHSVSFLVFLSQRQLSLEIAFSGTSSNLQYKSENDLTAKEFQSAF